MGARPVALLDGLCFGEPGWQFRPRGRGDRRTTETASACRTSAARPFSTRRTRETARQRDVRRPAPGERVDAREGAGTGQRARPLRRDHRSRRHRRRVGAREPGARRGRRGQAALGAGRRSVHRQEADRSVARARRGRAGRVAAGLRCRGTCVVAVGDGERRSGSTCTSTACRCASRTSSRGK